MLFLNIIQENNLQDIIQESDCRSEFYLLG